MPPHAPRNSAAPPWLIVNADDLGMSKGIDAAIFEGHDRGIITSTSLMAGGDAFDDAVLGVRARPRLGCGVHLVLHELRPVLPAERVPDLVDDRGRPRALSAVVGRLLTGRISAEQVEAEYAAQIERVIAAGIQPTHLDSHCHLHALPMLGLIVHRLGRRYSIPCARRPEVGGWADFRDSSPMRIPVAWMISANHRRTRRKLDHALRMPDRLIGLVRSGALDAPWIERAIANLADGSVCELMVHPGDGTGEGDPNGDHGPAQRKRELDALTSTIVLDAVRKRGVELVDYRRLAAC